MKKGFLQISFGWLFALVAGAFILFMAIYFIVQFMGVENQSQSAVTSNDIGILLNPLETGFEQGRRTSLELSTDTRIENGCSDQGNFGKQTLSVSQKTFGEWPDQGIDAVFENKYLFSYKLIEGRKFVLFSKPFNFPFKVSDLIYIIPEDEEYCFTGASSGEVFQEIKNLEIENVKNSSCSPNSIKVCFPSGDNCDIKVDLITRVVIKGSNNLRFEGDALMYAAIFSDADLYRCQVKRLIERQKKLATIYSQKKNFVAIRNCNSNADVAGLASRANDFEDLGGLGLIALKVEEVKNSNDRSQCKLW